MGIRDSNLEGSERIYSFLLLLYPPGFRLRFGSEMIQIFRDINPRDEQGVGFARRMAFWLWVVHDLGRSLPGEWRQALIRADRIELPVRQWADSLVVPFVVGGSLMVAGNLVATLVRNGNLPPTVYASGRAWSVASMLAISVGVGLGLGILGILGVLIAARRRRGETWIRL